jgi:secreted trypsin-like serine protease
VDAVRSSVVMVMVALSGVFAVGCSTVGKAIETSRRVGQDVARAKRVSAEGPGESGIVNGQDVAPGSADSKLAVLLLIARDSKLSACSGVLISRRVVLTAAHCVFNVEPKNVKAIFSTRDTKSANDIIAEKIRLHEKYDGTPKSFSDLALVRLAADSPESYKPATLASAGEKVLDDDVLLIGYGITSEEKKDSMQLRATTKSFKNDIHLKETFLGIDQKSKTGGFCRGDSGAPVFVTIDAVKKLYGINSFTVAVEENKECHTASVAMLVPFFSTWILSNAAQL